MSAFAPAPDFASTIRCPGCAKDRVLVARSHIFGSQALLRCVACRTEFVDPQPTDARLAEIYGPDYYSPWTVESAETVDAMKRATFAPMLDACEIRSGTRVLDLGCATGSFLAEATRRGAVAYGIDLNSDAIAEARRRIPDANLHAGLARDQPFPEVTFDAAVMIDFIEHVRHPEAELRTVRQWMQPDSKLVISTPRVDSALRRAMRQHWPQYREEHLTYFSRAGITALLERVGWKVERVIATRKALTLAYACGQARAYPVPVLSQVTELAFRILKPVRHRQITVSLGEMTVVARLGTP